MYDLYQSSSAPLLNNPLADYILRRDRHCAAFFKDIDCSSISDNERQEPEDLVPTPASQQKLLSQCLNPSFSTHYSHSPFIVRHHPVTIFRKASKPVQKPICPICASGRHWIQFLPMFDTGGLLIHGRSCRLVVFMLASILQSQSPRLPWSAIGALAP